MGKKSISNIDNDVKLKFRRAIEQHLNVKCCDYATIKAEAQKDGYQCFVCGSDQIWSPLGMVVRKHKFLEFAPKEKRIAYAPSFGVEYVPEYNRRIFKKKLAEMSRISVRENAGKRIVEELLDVDNVPVVLDPTLLWDNEFWLGKAEQIQQREKYICCYFLNEPTMDRIQEIREFAERKKLEILVLPYKNAIVNCEGAKFVPCGPFEFLNVIKKAEYVFTDSYHGTIFAIQFQKQFVSFERQHRKEVCQVSRLLTLLDSVGLSERFVQSGTWEKALETTIEYADVSFKLEELREKSMNYLISAIQDVEMSNE